jgi:hypothetical protein
MPELTPVPFDVTGGYWPSSSDFPPQELWNTIKAGLHVWLRPGNKLQVARGPAQTSATNVGARLFAVNTDRGSIAGGLVSGRLPFASILRYDGAVLFYLSEITSQQVFLNESALAGVLTSSTAGRLRIAVPDGLGGHNAYDSGFDPVQLPSGNVTTLATGTKQMKGDTGVALCAWRTITDAIGPPSEIVYKTLTPGSADVLKILLPAAASGQDGFIYAGTRTGDRSGALQVVRYVYIQPRGVFDISAGGVMTGVANTRWMRDLRVGDDVLIGANTGTVATITGDGAATLSGWGGGALSTQTMTLTSVAAEWYDDERGVLVDRDVQRPPLALGVFQFGDRVFLWGTYQPGVTSRNTITPMLDSNPEHVGLFNIKTAYGNDLLNVMPGDQTIWLMTRNTLESLNLNGDAQKPYTVRAYEGVNGFASPKCGVVYRNRFYGYTGGGPFRTVTDADIDVDFAQAVIMAMPWGDGRNVVLAVDPVYEAVLYCHYEPPIPPFVEGTTTIIPYMAQLGKWGPDHQITGQVTDWAVVNGALYLVVVTSSGNYRVQTWEGGSGRTDAYVASQYVNSADRWKLKRIVFTGRASTIKAYVARIGAPPTDVRAALGADATFTLPGGLFVHPEIFTDLGDGRGLALRVDFPVSGEFQKLIARGYELEASR